MTFLRWLRRVFRTTAPGELGFVTMRDRPLNPRLLAVGMAAAKHGSGSFAEVGRELPALPKSYRKGWSA